MKSVAEYITDNDKRDFCRHCNEICSGHCAIWRKASQRYDLDNLNGPDLTLNKRYGIVIALMTVGVITSSTSVGMILFILGLSLTITSYINVKS